MEVHAIGDAQRFYQVAEQRKAVREALPKINSPEEAQTLISNIRELLRTAQPDIHKEIR